MAWLYCLGSLPAKLSIAFSPSRYCCRCRCCCYWLWWCRWWCWWWWCFRCCCCCCCRCLQDWHNFASTVNAYVNFLVLKQLCVHLRCPKFRKFPAPGAGASLRGERVPPDNSGFRGAGRRFYDGRRPRREIHLRGEGSNTNMQETLPVLYLSFFF